ncbi:MAG: OmpH family outer membrane protein, partial [Rhodobacteraceae bacterium]
MRRALAYAAALLLGLHGASAQEPAGSVPPAAPQILTIDQDRLFSETVFGGRVSAELEDETGALTAENRRIEAELIAEERKLTDLRETMEPAAFQT